MKKQEMKEQEYYQPEFYHFSEDSIFLAKKVSSILLNDPLRSLKSPLKILDLCAGSGVVGIELLRSLSMRVDIDFCELQTVFTPYLIKNIKIMNLDHLSPHLFFHSFEELKFTDEEVRYDVILSNPPYFCPQKFRLSQRDDRKNLCRFFLQGTREGFLKVNFDGLRVDGKSYFLQREESEMEKSFVLLWPYFLDQGFSPSLKVIGRHCRTNLYEFSK